MAKAKAEQLHGQVVKEILPGPKALWFELPEPVRQELTELIKRASELCHGALVEWAKGLENRMLAAYLCSVFETRFMNLYFTRTKNAFLHSNPLFYLNNTGWLMNFIGVDDKAVWFSGVVPMRVWKRLVTDPIFREKFFLFIQNELEKR